jgi:hypothetical protein
MIRTTQMQLPASEELACNDVQVMICSASAIHCCNVCVLCSITQPALLLWLPCM